MLRFHHHDAPRTPHRLASLGVALAAAAVCSTSLSAPAAAGGPAPSAAAATTVKLPDGPGSVAGLADDAEVGLFTGQVSYGVPFSLPAGRAGLAPSLGLGYSGNLGNGPVGVGWSLSHAAIRRSTRHGVPTFTDADELELVGLGGGGRLVKVADDEYRVEGQGNELRVVRHGNRFQITDSNGTIYYLGWSEQSRQADADGRTTAWLPEKVVHLAGDWIDFAYLHREGQLYLERLRWGPERRFEAELQYESRPDPVVSYRAGLRVLTNRRLARVRVRAVGTELRAYHLTYADDFPLSRLASVEMTGYQGEGSLPVLRFGYAEPQPPTVQRLGGTEGWALETRGVVTFDVDGDGIHDLYRLEMGNHEYRRNLGGTFGPRTRLNGATALEHQAVRFLDLDGNARAEMVRIVNDTWRYSRLVDGAWQTVGIWPGTRNLPLHGPGIAFGDVNGDGRTDALQSTTGGIRLWLNGPAGMSRPRSLPPLDSGNVAFEPGGDDVTIDDVNGDGLADAVWMTDAWMKILLGRGDGTFAPWQTTYYPWPSDSAIDRRNLRAADLDRDGISDLILFTAAHVVWYQGRSDGSLDPDGRRIARPDGVARDVTVAIADVNGNGSQDIVWSSPRGMWLVDLAGPTSAGMLTTIANGLGKVVTYDYRASALLSLEAEHAGQPWQHKLPTSIPIPVRVSVNVGDGSEPRVVHYNVRDGLWDGHERRFAGFLEGRTVVGDDAAADTVVSITRFNPGLGDDRVLRGSANYARVETGLGEVVNETHTELAAQPVAAQPPALQESWPHHPLLRVAVTRTVRAINHDGLAAGSIDAPRATLQYFEHDDQGRVIAEHDRGRLDLEGDESIARRTLGDNLSRWLRGRTCTEALHDGDDLLVSESRTRYGTPNGTAWPTNDCELGELGDGIIRAAQAHYLEEDRWIDVTTTTYDDDWNPRVVYADGVTRTLDYDDLGLFATSESLLPSSDTTLTWSASWDTTRGLITAVADAAGVSIEASYDALGRPVSLARAGQPPHIHYEYDWTAPWPSASTWVFDGTDAELAASPWPGTFIAGSGWRQGIEISNGAGERRLAATRVADDQWLVSSTSERDHRGRVIRVLEPFTWNQADINTASAPANARAQTIGYDGLDRIIEQRLPSGAGKIIEHWAFGTRVVADDLAPVESQLDGKGRIRHTHRTVATTGVESVNAIYDAAGRIVTLRLQARLADQLDHSFHYDSLGRMDFATDPDIGDRHLVYDDAGRLIEQTNAVGQSIGYLYDALGRLTRTTADDGTEFRYHYDAYDASTKLPDGAVSHVPGRLAWIEEPTGRVTLGYDAHGRQHWVRREIDGKVATETTSFTTSGLVRTVDFDHDLLFEIERDPAGRPIRVSDSFPDGAALGELWLADAFDGAGRLVSERYGNGVQQHYAYDANGNTSHVTIARGSEGSETLYDVAITRNAYGAITRVAECPSLDPSAGCANAGEPGPSNAAGRGLDHDAVFSYDGGGRLVDAVLGRGIPGVDAFRFQYQYSALQNMVRRDATGPKELGAYLGSYRYGEPGARQRDGAWGDAGPRQLTSVVADDDTMVAAFAYDAAGRQIAQDGRTLVYNGLDQLIRVEGLGDDGAGVVEHVYGHDGQRLRTRGADGREEIWFTPGILEVDGVREHYLRMGKRVIAKIKMAPQSEGDGAAFGAATSIDGEALADTGRVALIGLALLLVLAGLRRAFTFRGSWHHAAAGLALVATTVAGCGWLAVGELRQRVWTMHEVVYFHNGVAAGPVLFTTSSGAVFDERRYEPFGDTIDAYWELGSGGSQIGEIDFRKERMNNLNKPSDPNTGWSYHGARWLVPETARWTAPDPPVKAPDPKFMSAPWSLHPYQYVEQNPVSYWDPDGKNKAFYDNAWTDLHRRATAFRLRVETDSATGVMESMARAYWSDDEVERSIARNYYQGLADQAQAIREASEKLGGAEFAARMAAVERGVVTATVVVWGSIGAGIAVCTAGAAGTAKFVAEEAWEAATDLPAPTSLKGLIKNADDVGKFLSKRSRRARRTVNKPKPRSCFVAGTIVATADGPKPIEEIGEGDLVVSRDEVTGETSLQKVSATIVSEDVELFELTILTDNGRTETLETTAEHPFWVAQRGWVEVKDLEAGDDLLDATGGTLTVFRLVLAGRTDTVYNIEVDAYHTYFVGELEAWVHNKAAVPKWSIRARLRDAGLHGLPGGEANAKTGPFRYRPPRGYNPAEPLPRGPGGGYMDRFGNEWVQGPYHGKPGLGFHAEWDVQLSAAGSAHWSKYGADRGHGYINVRPDGELSH